MKFNHPITLFILHTRKQSKMKQSIRIYLSFAFVLFATAMMAQVAVSPKVGVNISALDTKLQDIRTEARVGWNAGVDVRLGGDRMIFLQPGLHYYSFSADLMKDINQDTELNLSERTTIQQVKMPVNVGFNLTGDGGLLGLHLLGGVTPTFVTGVKERPNFDLTKDDLNAFTLGANVGVGIDLLFLTAHVGYEIGLNDFFKEAEGKNNVLTLNVGLTF